MPSTRHFALTAAFAVLAAAAAPGFARENNAARATEACQRAVDLMGANLGSKTITRDDGAPALLFLVRANGLEYEVTCDAKTGVVSDVSPRPS